MMMDIGNLNFYIIISSAILFYFLFQGYFGKILQKLITPFVLYNLAFVLVLCLVLYLSSDIAYAMAPESSAAQATNSDLPRPEIKVSDNHINVNNPNTNVFVDAMAKGFINIGLGIAVAGGMGATASLLNNTPFVFTIKFGTMIGGGIMAGLIVKALSARKSIVEYATNVSTRGGKFSIGAHSASIGAQGTSIAIVTGYGEVSSKACPSNTTTNTNNINFGGNSTTNIGSFSGIGNVINNSGSRKIISNSGSDNIIINSDTTGSLNGTNMDASTLDIDNNITNMDTSTLDIDNNITNINIGSWNIEDCVAFSVAGNDNSVFVLLNSNYFLHVIILYLLFNLIILLLVDLVIKYNWKLLFIKNIFGDRFYNLVIKLINYTSKLNKIWIWVILILLVIGSIGSLSISYFLLNNINIISEIIQQFKPK
jgi:hypothetical protein